MDTSFTKVSGKLEFSYENGKLRVFSYETMSSIECDPKQTRDLLTTLSELREMIEQEATAQEAQETQPQKPLTVDERIDRLFS